MLKVAVGYFVSSMLEMVRLSPPCLMATTVSWGKAEESSEACLAMHTGQKRSPERKPLGMARQQEALPLAHAPTGLTLARLLDAKTTVLRTAAVEKDMEPNRYKAGHLGPVHIAGGSMTKPYKIFVH